jgi:hypothetical protein
MSTQPMIVMSVRTFQRTIVFWFVVATVNGFTAGVAVTALIHPW